jgi:hypothetical protein
MRKLAKTTYKMKENWLEYLEPSSDTNDGDFGLVLDLLTTLRHNS